MESSALFQGTPSNFISPPLTLNRFLTKVWSPGNSGFLLVFLAGMLAAPWRRHWNAIYGAQITPLKIDWDVCFRCLMPVSVVSLLLRWSTSRLFLFSSTSSRFMCWRLFRCCSIMPPNRNGDVNSPNRARVKHRVLTCLLF